MDGTCTYIFIFLGCIYIRLMVKTNLLWRCAYSTEQFRGHDNVLDLIKLIIWGGGAKVC